MFLRFANSIFEPLWNRDRIQCVQITMAENFGVRGSRQFLRPGRGAARCGAEPPAPADRIVRRRAAEFADADGLRDKRAEVFRAIPSIDPAHYMRGQYDGYRSIKGVRPDSQTETFAALRLEIDNWRWSGVPFFIAGRQGTSGAGHRDSGLLQAAAQARGHAELKPDPNQLVLRIDPNPGTDLIIQAKEPGANTHPMRRSLADVRQGTRRGARTLRAAAQRRDAR